jgi:mono/diheme cytochrome c family protein
MSRRRLNLVLVPMALVAVLCVSACGTERIDVPKQANAPAQGDLYHGAVLFSERCAGCHTLAAAGTHGSAANIRTAQGISGPNFNERCERPIARVLYAIENGGFSGQYMPQNIVVGHDAIDVAEFVARYAGQHASTSPGAPTCYDKKIGTLPANTSGLKNTDTASPNYTASSGG